MRFRWLLLRGLVLIIVVVLVARYAGTLRGAHHETEYDHVFRTASLKNANEEPEPSVSLRQIVDALPADASWPGKDQAPLTRK